MAKKISLLRKTLKILKTGKKHKMQLLSLLNNSIIGNYIQLQLIACQCPLLSVQAVARSHRNYKLEVSPSDKKLSTFFKKETLAKKNQQLYQAEAAIKRSTPWLNPQDFKRFNFYLRKYASVFCFVISTDNLIFKFVGFVHRPLNCQACTSFGKS